VTANSVYLSTQINSVAVGSPTYTVAHHLPDNPQSARLTRRSGWDSQMSQRTKARMRISPSTIISVPRSSSQPHVSVCHAGRTRTIFSVYLPVAGFQLYVRLTVIELLHLSSQERGWKRQDYAERRRRWCEQSGWCPELPTVILHICLHRRFVATGNTSTGSLRWTLRCCCLSKGSVMSRGSGLHGSVYSWATLYPWLICLLVSVPYSRRLSPKRSINGRSSCVLHVRTLAGIYA
jgi:hypothetical protein